MLLGWRFQRWGALTLRAAFTQGWLYSGRIAQAPPHLRSSHAYNSVPVVCDCGSKCTPASGSTPSVAVAVEHPPHALVVVGTHVAHGALMHCWINRRLSANPRVFEFPLSLHPAHTMQAHTFGSSSSSSSALLAINQAAAPGDTAALGTIPLIPGQPLLSQEVPCSAAAHAPTPQLQHRRLLSQPQEKEQQQQQQDTCLPASATGEASAAQLHRPLQAAAGEASHPSTPHLPQVRSPAWLLSVTTYCACCAGCLRWLSSGRVQ
jgi:hypothetical protein